MARTPKPWYWTERDGWYVTLKGKRRLLAQGKKSKAAAEREFHRLMLAEGRAVETDRVKMTLRDLVNLFLVDFEGRVERGERELSTFEGYRKSLVSAACVCGNLRVTEMRPHHALRWADSHPWGPSMRNIALTRLKLPFAWGKRVGHLEVNPLAGMELPRIQRREKIPSHEQVAAMLDAAWGQPFRDLLVALKETGCRPCEISTLQADRVDLAGGTWKVVDKIRSKTGERYRTVYLTPAMVELTRKLLAQHPEGLVFRNSQGRAWCKNSIAYRFTRLQKKLGFGPECCAYAFRHLYVTDALERGVNPAVVAELVGHKSLDQIMATYSKLRDRTAHLRDAVRQVRPEA